MADRAVEIYPRNMTSTMSHPTRPMTTASGLAFRKARLSVSTWAALLVPGALTGLGAALLSGKGRPGPVRLAALTLAGAGSAVLVARGINEVRWRRSDISLSVTEPDDALDLLQAVRAEGVHADMVRADHQATTPAYAVRYRAKDDRRVRRVLAAQHA